jgi:hypothetical protein
MDFREDPAAMAAGFFLREWERGPRAGRLNLAR